MKEKKSPINPFRTHNKSGLTRSVITQCMATALDLKGCNFTLKTKMGLLINVLGDIS